MNRFKVGDLVRVTAATRFLGQSGLSGVVSAVRIDRGLIYKIEYDEQSRLRYGSETNSYDEEDLEFLNIPPVDFLQPDMTLDEIHLAEDLVKTQTG